MKASIMFLFLAACGGATSPTIYTDSSAASDVVTCKGYFTGAIGYPFSYNLSPGDGGAYYAYLDVCTNTPPSWCDYTNENAYECNAESTCIVNGENGIVRLTATYNPTSNKIQVVYELPNVVGRFAIYSDCGQNLILNIP